MGALTAYAGGPWASEEIPNTLPPGWKDVPPPIPDATTHFLFTARPATSPWAGRSWAGASPTVAYVGGGITVAPDATTGVMLLWAWWPDAPQIQVVRVGQDGSRSPVRGAYGLTVTGDTRRNLCSNPSFETSLAGYLPIDGDTTLSQVTTAPYVTSGTYAMRMVSTTTTTGAVMPGTMPGSGQQYTIALDLGLTATVTSVDVTVTWLNSTGGSAGSSVLTMTADQLAAAVGQSSRVVWTLASPVTAVTGSASMTITGLAIGESAYLDSVVYEAGTTTGSYYDGGSFGGAWSGTENLSTSILSPVQEIVDGECPLDVPVTYEVYNPALVGGFVASTSTVLASGNRVWLTHPESPTTPVEVLITTTPDVTYVLEQAVYPILDSRYPVVVSASERLAPSGVVEILVEGFAARDRTVYETFGDGTPVLKRTPAAMGYGEGEWIVLGDLREQASGYSPFDPVRTLQAPFQVVEAPEVVT